MPPRPEPDTTQDQFDFDRITGEASRAWQRDRPEIMAVDTETTGLTWSDKPFAMTVAWEGEAHYLELDNFVARLTAEEMLNHTPTVIYHNAKFDMRMLIMAGLLKRNEITWERFHDTETIAQLLNENRRLGLEPLTKTVLGIETDWKEVLRKTKRECKLTKDDGYHLLPREVLIPYAVTDAEYTFLLWKSLYSSLNTGLIKLYEQERKLTLVLLDMETAGMRIDRTYAKKMVKEYGLEILKLRLAIEKTVGNENFNANSPAQIIDAFRKLGVVLTSTNKLTLQNQDHPLASLLLDYRKLMKLRATYLMPMLEESYPDGILHPNIRQHGTKTGRMSSGAANNN